MSAAAAGGGAMAKYVAVELEEDFRPSEVDMAFAESFRMTASVIDECRNAELVALLLSTCRNQWMAVNGMFVDLQGILGADRLPDLAARAFHHLDEGDPAAAAKCLREALQLRAALAGKLHCWSRREELLDQLKEAIADPQRDPLERDRLEGWLLRQGHGPSIRGRIRQAQYLRLDLADTHCPQQFELIERGAAKLTGALRIAHRTVRVLSIAEDVGKDDAEGTPEQLFDLPADPESDAESVQDREADDEQKLAGAWARLEDAVRDHGRELGFKVRDGEAAIELEASEGECFHVEAMTEEVGAAERISTAPPAALEELVSRSREAIERVRTEVFEAFTPNVETPPMPAPFVVDLTPDDLEPSEGRVRTFTVKTADGRQSAPNTAKLALLRCGMPLSAYLTTRKGHLAYDPKHQEGARKAKQIALDAVSVAAQEGAAFLALPEVFLPRTAEREVVTAAEQAKIGLIAGLEYPEKRGGPVNEVLVHVPGWVEPLRQRKQGPSVEEIKHTSFESTLEIFFIRRTALGDIGVVVCSDIMELDVLWALASFEQKLDVVFVCSHNHRPEIFERIAIADATRLHAFVVVVNSWTPRPKDPRLPSGKGTVVAHPDSASPFLSLAEQPLSVGWEGEIEQPNIAFAELDIAQLRERELERPGAHGYISPPRFARD